MKYQWFISNGSGEDQSFEPLATQCSRKYKVRFEGRPKIEKLEIEGRGFHTNLYAVQGIYSGGKEGKSKIQWLRSMVGSPDLISIPGEIGRTYEANVDDVGYRLDAIYTPISVSTEQIAVGTVKSPHTIFNSRNHSR